MDEEEILREIQTAVIDGNKEDSESLARQAIKNDMNLSEVIEKGYTIGIQKVGDLWQKGEYFLPELITSAECMKFAMNILIPQMQKGKIMINSLGKIIIGTIEGDIHDIGKNLVASLLSANGFQVFDLGSDVRLEYFIEKAEEEDADFICLSSLLTTTMLGQKRFIEMLKEKNLFGRFKIMVGGAPVNRKWAEDIGADGYAGNAMSAVVVAKSLTANKSKKGL